MKLLLVILAVLVGCLVALEVCFRFLGFGKLLIYLADQEIGYLLAPNQCANRLGNRIFINEYSMRSPSTTIVPPASTLRVLLLGDSVANGGWWTDQDQTISALLMSQLEPLLDKATNNNTQETTYQRVEVLNASANSWGPRNELAYLQRFGNFGVPALVLLINTDDLFAPQPTSLPVGRDRNYPVRQPALAILEVISRLLPRQTPPEIATVKAEPGDQVGFNLEAINQIKLLAKAAGTEFVLAMTPLLREIGEPGPRDYELKERAKLAEFTQQQQITYLDFLPIFNSDPKPKTLYRDHIHLNFQGNQKVSEVLGRLLQPLLAPAISSVTAPRANFLNPEEFLPESNP
ncbi:GDSL-type esterase/lipase family protein [Lyngbya aestuarii]|uniref:GDSL-type esterase/lipase family protein n=1 Tax=Lyngbya aestuarii TaxID=118322 RepID=UPI00403D7276